MAEAFPIEEGMEVLGSDGVYVGTIDHFTDRDIKLNRKDPESVDGMHHLIPLTWVAEVETEAGKVRLNRTKIDAETHWRAI